MNKKIMAMLFFLISASILLVSDEYLKAAKVNSEEFEAKYQILAKMIADVSEYYHMESNDLSYRVLSWKRQCV